jgi:predicted RNA-binding Zn ribbon-like protein
MTERHPAPYLIGDHLAMDFLNSRVSAGGDGFDWLGDGAGLLDWLLRAGAIDAAVARQFQSKGKGFGALDVIAEQARNLREWLRDFVERHAGHEIGPAVMEELASLNRLLARDDTYRVIEAAGSGADGDGRPHDLRWRRVRRWTTPERLLMPLAETIGDLVCHADFRLVRACEGTHCVLMFYDRTKAHARRWCSMAVCGNRAKAAAHRARHRHPSAAAT